MALQERHAVVEWSGNLREGKGKVGVGSGALRDLPVTFSARESIPTGMTSPEELMAAANAICFAMAFSSTLTKAGNPPERLVVTATCALDRKPEGGLKITSMTLDVRGRVPGIADDKFRALATEAGNGCPVSSALKNNVEMRVNSTLER